MDLYADLPLAKGTAANDVDGDGNSKAAPVWAKGVATTFQPGQRQAAPAATSVSMLPSSVAAARGKSPVDAAKPAGRGFSLAFRPASLARKAPSGAAATAAARSTVFGHAKPTEAATAVGDGTSAARGGLGFVAATTWTQVTTVQKDSTEEVSADPSTGDATVANVHFFQATYRDEYHPSRPNNYEAFCKERAAKKKMEQVKRELEERQRQQERESKREREQFAKDVSEGKAPSIALPMSAGRGRGMTVPAWMRKKIEESGSQGPTAPPVAESVLTGTHETQFENAPTRGGLGFSSGPHQRDAGREMPSRDEFGRDITTRNDRTARDHDNSVQNRSNRHSRSRSRDRHHHAGSHGPERSVGANGDAKQRSVDHTDGPRRKSHGSQRPGRVILLQNMVGPGEVDDELEQEVKDECSTKYGPVEKCVVLEQCGRGVVPEEAVRIFVEFRHQTHADQALHGLNSRFFGGRRVKAAYYDEDRFARRELSA